tara:strand:- start:528 stop:689 length:162 start_codon:yes stop_codon:yes gene_type:complete
MAKAFSKLKSFLKSMKPKSRQEREHEWLAQSSDLVDLERRQKILTNSNLKGWV